MSNRTSTTFAIALVILGVLLSLYFYPSFPQRIASHWNVAGEVDGTMSKSIGLFLSPALSLGLLLIFLLLPKIDPLRANIKAFRAQYNILVDGIILFLFVIHLFILLWNLDIKIPITQVMGPALGFLFVIIGIVLPRTKRNWFVGIRTPWTLSDDRVWTRTHTIGGILFVVSGVLAFVGAFIPKFSFYLAIIPIVASAIFLVGYSYYVYKDLQ